MSVPSWSLSATADPGDEPNSLPEHPEVTEFPRPSIANERSELSASEPQIPFESRVAGDLGAEVELGLENQPVLVAEPVLAATDSGNEAAGHEAEGHEAAEVEGSVGMRGRNRYRPGRRSAVKEWSAIGSVAVLVAVLVRTFAVQAFWIPSASMVPTLKVGDRLLVEKITPSVRDLHRREVVVFERPKGVEDTSINDLIKRVIGLPGDLVEGREGKVFINGVALLEPYLPAGTVTSTFKPVRIPIDSYFVMGDNRALSYDSRYWGPINRRIIVGRAVIRIWPPSKFGSI
jgi:signal peptidase I